MSASDLRLLAGPAGLQVLAGLGVGAALLLVYRWMRRRAPAAAAILAAGFLLRAALGLGLFWISWLDLPLLDWLHTGDGFWALAPDARGYMFYASRAATLGLETITPGMASPTYQVTLAMWMRGVGISPITGMYLNLVAYTLLCAGLVLVWRPRNEWRSDLPLLVLLAAFSFSPVQVIHSSQTLKDDLFAFTVAASAGGALVIAMAAAYGSRAVHSGSALAAGVLVWLGGIYYAAGIRAYFAFFMFCALAAVLALFGLRPRRATLYLRVPLLLVICALTAWCYARGAGAYETYLRAALRTLQPAAASIGGGGLLDVVATRIAAARLGFERSGGGTNIASVPVAAAPAPPAELLAPALPVDSIGSPAPLTDSISRTLAPDSLGDNVQRLAVGLAVLFVPISLLQLLSITGFTGGRGLLFVTDIDTVFVDVSILGGLALLYWRWDIARRRLPFVTYLLLLGTVTAMLLAYVVTNFGTLFRLRIMAVVPFWLLLLAAADEDAIPAAPAGGAASPPAPVGTAG